MNIIRDDITKANDLRNRFANYLEGFRDIDDPMSIQIAKNFVREFEKFEENNLTLAPLNFLYGDMSKAYLHSKDF